jgi:hypothetical protein
MIINDDTSVGNKFEPSLTDDTRAVIYDRHMFIVQATGVAASPANIRQGRKGQKVRNTILFLKIVNNKKSFVTRGA